MRVKLRVLTMALLATLGREASAQLFSEDWESGTVDAGVWRRNAVPGISITAQSAAARRGAFGMRMTDTESAVTVGSGVYIRHDVADAGPSFFIRAWARLASYGGSGDCAFFASTGNNVSMSSGTGRVNFTSQPTALDGGLGYLRVSTPQVFSDGGWHLLEVAIWDDTLAVAAFDGQEIARNSYVTSEPDKEVYLGGLFQSSGGFVGAIDFDDVRADSRPLGSWLKMVGAPLAVNHCSPLVVSLAASYPTRDGGEPIGIAAPYPISLEVEGLPVFTDPQCTDAGAGVFPRSATEHTLYALPSTQGAASLRVAHAEPQPDFLPGALEVTVGPEDVPPTPVERSYYALQCGVAAPASPVVLLALAFAARRRRR